MQISGIFSKIKTTIVIGGLFIALILCALPQQTLAIYHPTGGVIAGDIFINDSSSSASLDNKYIDDPTNGNTYYDENPNDDYGFVFSNIYNHSINYYVPNIGTWQSPANINRFEDMQPGHYTCMLYANGKSNFEELGFPTEGTDNENWCNIFYADGNIRYKCYLPSGNGTSYSNKTVSCSNTFGCNQGNVKYGVWSLAIGDDRPYFYGCVSRCNMTLESSGDDSKTCVKKAISVPPANCYIDLNNNWTAMKCDCNERYYTSRQPDDPDGDTKDRECTLCPDNASCSNPNGTFYCDNRYYRNGDNGDKCLACPTPPRGSGWTWNDVCSTDEGGQYSSCTSGATSISQCFIDYTRDKVYEDDTGGFKMTGQCFYKN